MKKCTVGNSSQVILTSNAGYKKESFLEVPNNDTASFKKLSGDEKPATSYMSRKKYRSRKKVLVPVPEKFGPGKKYRSQYRKKLVPEKSTGTGIGENWSRYRRIPGNSRSLYIFISSCTFRHWEKEMSLLGKPSPKKTILLMKVYVSSPEKMFMFWGHELMMVSCLQQVSSKEIWGM